MNMKHRMVESAPVPEIRKRRVSRAGTVLARCGALLLVTLVAALAAAWGFCFLVFRGPSPAARDKLAVSLSESSATRFIPGLFLSEEELDGILDQEVPQ